MIKRCLLLLFLSSSAFAFFCPKNFQDIQLGDSLEAVLQKCGPADSQKEIIPPDIGPQEWIYNITVAGQGSLRMSVMLQDDKILNIVANSMSLPSTTICGAPITVGDPSTVLKAACGTPTLINKGADSGTKPEPLIELRYEGTPPQTLIFENKKLKSRQQN